MLSEYACTLLLTFLPNYPTTTQIYTLSLHDALPICRRARGGRRHHAAAPRPARGTRPLRRGQGLPRRGRREPHRRRDRRRPGHDRPHPRDPRPHHPGPPGRWRPCEPRGGRAGQVRREADGDPAARHGAAPMSALRLAPVEAAIAAIAAGAPVVVVDDEDRENEGDLILAAAAATPALIGFAVRHSSGLLCAPMSAARADALELPLMVRENADPLRTAYTVS